MPTPQPTVTVKRTLEGDAGNGPSVHSNKRPPFSQVLVFAFAGAHSYYI